MKEAETENSNSKHGPDQPTVDTKIFLAKISVKTGRENNLRSDDHPLKRLPVVKRPLSRLN